MTIQRFMVAALCALGPLTCVAHGGNINGEATYVSFSVPGALGTYPMGINASMTVTGYYYVSPTVARGFLREADGTITTFDVAGGIWTQPEGINATGNITGFYELVAGVPRGFLRYADGRIVTFDPPPSQKGVPLQAQPVSINDFDEIAGTYPYSSILCSICGPSQPKPAAFTRSREGVFYTIPVPFSDYFPGLASLQAAAINASGAVVGFLAGYEPVNSGFVAHPDGYWAEFFVPQTLFCGIGQETIPEGINAGGIIAGWYANCNTENNIGGFVRSPEGNLTLFQPPGTILTPPLSQFLLFGESLTAPHWVSIDQAGDITGSYTDTAGVQHGFVRNPYGTMTSFDPPEGKQTTATSISDGGAIAGFYQYNAGGGPPVGFIRVPQ